MSRLDFEGSNFRVRDYKIRDISFTFTEEASAATAGSEEDVLQPVFGFLKVRCTKKILDLYQKFINEQIFDGLYKFNLHLYR